MMTKRTSATTQPRAIWLAETLVTHVMHSQSVDIEAATELRRLHAENAELLEALKTVTKHLDVVSSNTTDLEVVWAAEKVIDKATEGAPCQ